MVELDVESLVEDIENGKSLFITGEAGVGKTHLLKTLFKRLTNVGFKVALTSTTGINALNLGGMTIHKLTGIGINTNPSYIKFMKKSFLYSGIKKRMEKIDVIIIDEVSMLRADQFELINSLLQSIFDNTKPFGGMTMIFTGDFFQIPPVVKSWEKNQTQWLFNSPIWKTANIDVINLTKVHRQTDKDFIKLLGNIRKGIYNEECAQIIKQCEKNILPEDTTKFFSLNQECDAYNESSLNALPGEYNTYEAKITARRNKKEKEAIIRDIIAKPVLKLKVGAKVLAIYNDPEGQYVNGSTGVVTAMLPTKVEVLFDGRKIPTIIKKHDWVKVDVNNKKIATFEQIPLIPAYALTIHKSQGMTLDSAIVDCKNIFAHGQLYVALSRVRTKEKLKIINFSIEQIVASNEVKEYYESLNKTI